MKYSVGGIPLPGSRGPQAIRRLAPLEIGYEPYVCPSVHASQTGVSVLTVLIYHRLKNRWTFERITDTALCLQARASLK